MSWVFGVIGSAVDQDTVARCQAIHSLPIGQYRSEGKYYLAAGGLHFTCLLSHTGAHEGLEAFGITLGCTFSDQSSRFSQLTQRDWNDIREKRRPIDGVEGHFVHIAYAHDRFEIRNDRLGLRTLYWMQTKSETVISTRLDWIAKYVHGAAIDWKKFGSRWLIFNQLSYESPLTGVQRLAPSGQLCISPQETTYSFSAFTPSVNDHYQPTHFTEKLNRFVNPVMQNGLRISLGLSGGLDSRVLLSLMLHAGRKDFTTHTFGNAEDPDVAIPARIAGDEGFPHAVFDSPIPETSAIISQLTDYIAQTNLIEPISTALRLRHYNGLDSSKYLLMDGGFGEVARRQYLNRLALKGKSVIEKKSADVIFGSMRANRGSFFSDEVNEAMSSGVKDEIVQMLESMPDISKIGMDNYLDLWAVRTRIPNFGSDAQAMLDATILNFMPFAQPSFIESVFSMPVTERRNGRFFRRLIGQHHRPLQAYPMVKNGTTYPFMLPTYACLALTKAKAKLGHQFVDDSIHVFLHAIKDYAMDILRSQETREYSPYNYAYIEKAVAGYYAGNKALSNEVNWWLSFDLWRRNIEP